MFSRDQMKQWSSWTQSKNDLSQRQVFIFLLVVLIHLGLVKLISLLPDSLLKQHQDTATPIVLHDPDEFKDKNSQQGITRAQPNPNRKKPDELKSSLSTVDNATARENIPKGEMREPGVKKDLTKPPEKPDSHADNSPAADVGPQILSPRLDKLLPKSSLSYSNAQKKLGGLSLRGSGQATAMGDPESENDGAIDINTREYKYAHYFDTMMRQVEEVWRYPEEAWRAGMHGRAIFDIVISRDGTLKTLRMVKSTGYSVLDYEIQRAVYSASPFNPVPTRIEQDPLIVRVTFTYTLSRYGIF